MKKSEIGLNLLNPSPTVDFTADNYSPSSKSSNSSNCSQRPAPAF